MKTVWLSAPPDADPGRDVPEDMKQMFWEWLQGVWAEKGDTSPPSVFLGGFEAGRRAK